jgi:hypothetical protein
LLLSGEKNRAAALTLKRGWHHEFALLNLRALRCAQIARLGGSVLDPREADFLRIMTDGDPKARNLDLDPVKPRTDA